METHLLQELRFRFLQSVCPFWVNDRKINTIGFAAMRSCSLLCRLSGVLLSRYRILFLFLFVAAITQVFHLVSLALLLSLSLFSAISLHTCTCMCHVTSAQNTGVEGGETAIKLARRWGYDVKGVEEVSV